ncbi:MAG: hypothetical protein ABL308_12615 [Oceanicaulis sp.]
MRVVIENGKPAFETDAGAPFPFGVAVLSLSYVKGAAVEAEIALDLVKVRAMIRPRVCLSVDGELKRVAKIEFEDGSTLDADALRKLAES